MPKCIVCQGYYEAGQPCQRCRSDNSAWEKWKRKEEALGAPGALLDFLAPHLYMPLIIAGWALAFGLLGMLWPWGGVRAHVLVLAIALTFVGCILATQYVYARRFALREQELLRKVRRGRKKGAGIERQIWLVLAIALGLAMLLTLLLVQSRMVWELMEWLVLEPLPAATVGEDAPLSQEGPGLREKVQRVFPLMCLNGYVTLAAFAYSSSLMLAQEYARRLNERLPQPIFLQEYLLTEVVRSEAERIVRRQSTPNATGGEETQNRTDQGLRSWTWDEMERTDDGGIRLKAVVRAGSKTEGSPKGELKVRPAYDTYVVEADPWGRISKVARAKESE